MSDGGSLEEHSLLQNLSNCSGYPRHPFWQFAYIFALYNGLRWPAEFFFFWLARFNLFSTHTLIREANQHCWYILHYLGRQLYSLFWTSAPYKKFNKGVTTITCRTLLYIPYYKYVVPLNQPAGNVLTKFVVREVACCRIWWPFAFNIF